MKHYPWKFKIARDGIEWHKIQYEDGASIYCFYFMWSWMRRSNREAWRKVPLQGFNKVIGTNLFGLHKTWYDGPHAVLTLYFIQFSWSTPWTTVPKDFWK
jgi:hypothetical protein